MKKITQIRSIDRYNNTEGGCDYIINLRPAGNKWKPFKAKNSEYFCGYNNMIYHHHVLPSDQVIMLVDNQLQLKKLTKISSQLISVIDTVLNVKTISSLGNTLIVTTDTDIRYYLYKHELKGYQTLPPLDGEIQLQRVKEFGVGSLNIVDPSDSFEGAIANYFEGVTKKAKDNFYTGHILLTYAFEFVDGNTFRHGNIIYESLDFVSKTARRPYVAYYISTEIPNAEKKYMVNFRPCKLKLKMVLDGPLIASLQQYKDVISSVNIYAHYIQTPYNWSTESTDYEKLSGEEIDNGSFLSLADVYFPKQTDDIQENFFETVTFRKIHEFKLEDILTYNLTEYVLNLTNFNQKQLLDIDNNSHHSISSLKTPYVFNNSIHFPGVVTKFGQGVNNNAFLPTGLDHFNISSSVSGYLGNKRNIIQIAEIKTDDGTYYAQKTLSVQAYHITDNQFILESFLSYPDRRATRIIFLKENFELIAEYQLKPHNTLNISYVVFKEDDENIAALAQMQKVFIPGSSSVLSFETGKLFRQPYRLQVSEINNPLYFPARQSYEIDKSESLVSCTTVAEEVGTGQRGQFPLFLFSDSQIYLLQQGQGDILYQQILPLHRIGIKGNAVSVSRNVMFAAHDGLYIMDGRGQITNISKSISNPPEQIDPVIDSQLEKSKHPITFDDFLENSIFLYDNRNREILISNPELQFSFVYNQDHQAWYIRSEYFTQALTIQAKQYFVRERRIYNQEESEGDNLPFYLQSNILHFSTTSHKKISRSILRGRMKTESKITFSIFTETNGEYHLSGNSTKTSESQKPDIMNPRLPGSSKSFIFVSTGKLTDNSEILFFETEFLETLSNKIR